MMIAAPTVVVLDPHRPTRVRLSAALEGAGYRVRCARCGEEAIGYLSAEDVSVLVTDLRTRSAGGEELIRALRRSEGTRGVPIIGLYDRIGLADMSFVRETGTEVLLPHSVDPEAILHTIAQLLPERIADHTHRPTLQPQAHRI